MFVVPFSDAVVEPKTVVVEVLTAAIASKAMFGIVVDTHLTDHTSVFEFLNVLLFLIWGLNCIKVSLIVNGNVCWILFGGYGAVNNRAQQTNYV